MSDSEQDYSPEDPSERVYPLPYDARKAFLTFLRRIREEVFGGNASEMARTIGFPTETGKKKVLRAIERDEAKLVDDEVVESVWIHLLDTLGPDAYRYGPTPFGTAILPRLVHRPIEKGGSFVVDVEVEDNYVIDGSEIGGTLPATDGSYFVMIAEGDALRPEISPGDQVAVELLHNPVSPETDGFYLLRMEDTVQLKRLTNVPEMRIRVGGAHEDQPTYCLDKGESDYDIIGFVRGHWRRLA